MRWIERLFPEKLRARQELKRDERAKLWLSVPDRDPCLRAVTDVLDDLIEGNAAVAGDVGSKTPEQRLEACNRMQIARQVLETIYGEREQARENTQKAQGG